MWVVGLINLDDNEMLLEIVQSRDSLTLWKYYRKAYNGRKYNIYRLLEWLQFFKLINSNYTYIAFNHSHGHLGKTSLIEGIWGN